jgi:hypothetical protein
MTFIGDASRDQTKIVDYLLTAQAQLEAAGPVFDLNGRKLEEMCKNHAHHLVYYDQIRINLKSLLELMETKRNTIESKLWRKYNEGYQRALSSRDIQAYIAGEPEYVAASEMILEINNVKEQAQAVVKAIEDMGWMLSHMTKLRVAEMQDAIL